MVKMKRNLLSVALATAAMMLATQVSAQDAQADAQEAVAGAKKKSDAKNLDAVVVTGIRGGIERAIDIKKDATSIVEAVSAEDIGKLPDVSIAESIARLPGLAAQRVAGRAQVISVRGLSPDFATTLLNGRELVSTGDNRSVEFDQYPSELMAGVTVYKTPDAALVGQGLSGTMDMRTVRPLDYDKPVVALSGRWQRNSLGSAANEGGTGNRFNASYIGQSADRTIGYSIGYSHSDTPIQENQVGLYEPWELMKEAGWRPGVPAGTYYSNGIKALRRTGYTKRDGVMGTLEVRASDAWISTLDVFHSQAKQENTANQFEVNLSGWNGGYDPGLNIGGATVNGNNTFTGGTVQNVYPLVRGMYNHRKDTIHAAGWRNEFFLGNGVKLGADLSWSKAKRDELGLENNAQIAPPPALDSIDLSIAGNGFSQMVPTLDYSDASKLFLRNTIYGSGYGKVPKVEDELKSARFDAEFPEVGMFASIKACINWTDRSKDKTQPEGNINVGAQGDTTIEPDLQYGLVDLGFAGIGMIPSWNVPGAVGRYMTFEPTDDTAAYLIPKAWRVEETIGTAFVQGNIDAMWGSVPVRGNIGVQIQRTDQSSNSRVWDSSQPAGQEIRPYANGKTYTDVLPSLNLAFSLAEDQTLRMALARQVARARVDQLRASVEFGVDTSNGKPGAGGGNPLLDPWRANAFDISWEKYFGSKAYIAAAYFYKDLRSYIFTQTRDGYDFTDLLVGWVPPAGMTVPVQTSGTMSAPFNGKGGKLQGVELTASLPLDMVFGDALQGFGVVASASFNDSSIKVLDPDSANSVGSDPISLPGLSKRVYNFTAYYERNGFEFRVNNRRRSDFIGEIGNFDGNRTLRYVVGENITDAQVSYSFGEGSALKGLSLLLQASNLGDEAYSTYAGSKDRPLEYIKWGRTLLLGASYKF